MNESKDDRMKGWMNDSKKVRKNDMSMKGLINARMKGARKDALKNEWKKEVRMNVRRI